MKHEANEGGGIFWSKIFVTPRYSMAPMSKTILSHHKISNAGFWSRRLHQCIRRVTSRWHLYGQRGLRRPWCLDPESNRVHASGNVKLLQFSKNRHWMCLFSKLTIWSFESISVAGVDIVAQLTWIQGVEYYDGACFNGMMPQFVMKPCRRNGSTSQDT